MTWTFLSFLFLVAGLLAVFCWSLLRATRSSLSSRRLAPGEHLSPLHVAHFPQIRQSLSKADLDFLAAQGSRRLARRARTERRRVALRYVAALHSDFRRLLQLARVLAALSPEVVAQQEAERIWLAVRFECRYRMVRAMLLLGSTPRHQLLRITQMTGTLSARLDSAMAEMGERAAQMWDFVSASD